MLNETFSVIFKHREVPYLALVATGSRSTFGLSFEPAGDGITARIVSFALLGAPAVASLSFVDNAVAAGSKVRDLIGLVE